MDTDITSFRRKFIKSQFAGCLRGNEKEIIQKYNFKIQILVLKVLLKFGESNQKN